MREQRGIAYNTLAAYLIRSDIPGVTTHFNKELHLIAIEAGRNVGAIVLSCDDMLERVGSNTKDDALAFRLAGAYCYTNSVHHVGVTQFLNFNDAIASLSKVDYIINKTASTD